MEKVVYILGAGFSAPLGLPVMSNFIVKAKDMYFQDPEKYANFEDIFQMLNQMSVIKNYFSTDLYNIEEVLSILEMNDYLNGENNSKKFKGFIKDVINYYTPDVKPYPNNLPGNWHQFVFGGGHLDQRLYGTFISNLFNLEVSRNNELIWDVGEEEKVSYSIVSLNYDTVLESYINFLHSEYFCKSKFSFNEEDIKNEYIVTLSKLHGCVNKENIVPPTWNKNSNTDLLGVWQNAWHTIKNANHIRIIGYSLPVSDSYIKYFLKSSILESPHLKTIDVITLDSQNDIKDRYDEFIDFNYFRFKNGNILDYFKALWDLQYKQISVNTKTIAFNKLEQAHSVYMRN